MDMVSELASSGPLGALLAIAAIVFGGGGLWAFLSARRTSRAADKKAATADWQALNTFWQAEMTAMKMDIKIMKMWHAMDERHIDRLEAHIWAGLGPPPPVREAYPTIIPEEE